jgi:hypothetical protein
MRMLVGELEVFMSSQDADPSKAVWSWNCYQPPAVPPSAPCISSACYASHGTTERWATLRCRARACAGRRTASSARQNLLRRRGMRSDASASASASPHPQTLGAASPASLRGADTCAQRGRRSSAEINVSTWDIGAVWICAEGRHRHPDRTAIIAIFSAIDRSSRICLAPPGPS